MEVGQKQTSKMLVWPFPKDGHGPYWTAAWRILAKRSAYGSGGWILSSVLGENWGW
jgi:hypothetical protein